MNKEITIKLTEKSHKHAEMMIHTIVDPSLVVFYKSNSDNIWEKISHIDLSWLGDKYFLCRKEYETGCFHWLNGGAIEFIVTGNEQWSDYISFKECEWESNMAFMREGLEFRIKQEPAYVKVESIFDLKRDEQYYCNSTGKRYDPIGEYPSERYLVSQLENNNLYRKLEKE